MIFPETLNNSQTILEAIWKGKLLPKNKCNLMELTLITKIISELR